MANRPITILRIKSDHSLKLSDHGNTEAEPGDTITWHIGRRSGVAAITSIYPKAGSPNVFNPAPAPVAHSSNWRGTIDPEIHFDVDEHYSIAYTTRHGEHFVDDPIISVRPVRSTSSILMLLFSFFIGLFCASAWFWRKQKSSK